MKPYFPFKLYLIGDRHQSIGRALTQVINEAGKAGITAFQFREKDLSLHAQYALASKIRVITRQLKMKLIINGRVDLCLALDADGVQLPVTGFPIIAARKLLGADRLIGLSCHSEADVCFAEKKGADFAVLGPVYPTPSKQKYGSALGLKAFKSIREQTNIPLFAIGGIKEDRLKAVFGAGADGVAIISAISSAKNIGSVCRNLLKKIEGFHSPNDLA